MLPATSWLAIAGASTLLAGPAAGSTRLQKLAGAGRLRGVPARAAQPARAVPRRDHRLPWRLPAAAGVLAVVGAIVAVAGPPLGIAAAAACGVGWLGVRDRIERHAAERRAADLLRALRVIIGELLAGSRPAGALAAAAEAAPAHGPTFDAAARSAADGFGAAGVLLDDPATRTLGLAWRLGESIGADLAAVVSRVEQDLVAADEQRRTVAVALAGPRASATMLSALPVLGIALGAAMGARPWDVLIGTPAGGLLACAGVLLDVGGLLWMRRILHRAEQP